LLANRLLGATSGGVAAAGAGRAAALTLTGTGTADSDAGLVAGEGEDRPPVLSAVT